MLDNIFKLKANNTTVKTEVIAGITTFLTMAYLLALTPSMLSKTGMDPGAVFTAAALTSMIATVLMGFLANLPIGLAPGIGASTFFVFTIVKAMGHSWEFAITAVLIEGIIFILLSIFKIREIIILSIPMCIKNAISCGIGLFIAFIGFSNAGIIKSGLYYDGNTLKGTMLSLGSIYSSVFILSIIGIFIIGILLHYKITGALLISIILTTIIGIPLGVTHIPSNLKFFSAPPSLSPVFFKFDFSHIFTWDMLITVITLLFMELFDTLGTLIGLATKAKILNSEGRVPNMKQALLSDAIGTVAGSCFGVSTVSTCVESATGITVGGKTGLTSITIAVLFIVALFFSPIFLLVPNSAVAPVLIIVGLFMLTPIIEIDFDNFTESIPCFLTYILMPYSYSIANGIFFGIISYTFLKIFTGKYRETNLCLIILSILFIVKMVAGV